MSAPVILIIGAGRNIGSSVAKKFASQGYRIALAARSLSNEISPDGYLHIQADLSNEASVPLMFQAVEKQLGPPNVVVYNGASRLTTPPDDPFSASLQTLRSAYQVCFVSAYVAAQETLRVFDTLPSLTPKAFIYTGNTLNQIGIPGVFPFALGKAAAATLVEYGANAYGGKGYRFYYSDQRQPNGIPAGEAVDGNAHAEMYWELVQETQQGKWLVTFTKEKGRENFEGVDFQGNTRF